MAKPHDLIRYYLRVLAGWTVTLALFLFIIYPEAVSAGQSSASQQEVQSVSTTTSENSSAPEVESENFDETKQPSEEKWRVTRMRVTAYCPCSKCCGEYSDGVTACNHHIQNGDRFVAADKQFSFGTEMIIPGYNNSRTVEVKDRGGAIQGERLDVYFDTHQQALEWGVQYLDVLIKIS